MELLAKMFARGTITREMKAAGERFNETFNRAHRSNLPAHTIQFSITNIGSPSFESRQRVFSNTAKAQNEVLDIIISAGNGTVMDISANNNNIIPTLAPISSAIWYILGMEKTIKSWAEVGWNNKPISPETASGILIASLGFLQRYYFVKDNK